MLEITTPCDEVVFRIECYIVNRQGQNALSFLLNAAHHQMFAEAGLEAGESQAAGEAMMSKATAIRFPEISWRSEQRGKMDRALVFYRMALDIGRTNPDLSAEYEHLRRVLGE